jgi:hypothetical protein
MPHTTAAYPFEAKVAAWAQNLSQCCAGHLCSFLVYLSPRGEVESIVFKRVTAITETERVRELGAPHIFFDPLGDGMEYIWLSWKAVTREVMERLIGQSFESGDFQGGGGLKEAAFPSDWGVMF